MHTERPTKREWRLESGIRYRELGSENSKWRTGNGKWKIPGQSRVPSPVSGFDSDFDGDSASRE